MQARSLHQHLSSQGWCSCRSASCGLRSASCPWEWRRSLQQPGCPCICLQAGCPRRLRRPASSGACTAISRRWSHPAAAAALSGCLSLPMQAGCHGCSWEKGLGRWEGARTSLDAAAPQRGKHRLDVTHAHGTWFSKTQVPWAFQGAPPAHLLRHAPMQAFLGKAIGSCCPLSALPRGPKVCPKGCMLCTLGGRQRRHCQGAQAGPVQCKPSIASTSGKP